MDACVVHVHVWDREYGKAIICMCSTYIRVGQRIPVCGCVRACAYMCLCVRGSARVCVCTGERQRESEEGDVGRVGQMRDVGWVRGFTWAHAANVSAVPNAMQQSGAQALPGGGPARSGVESAVRGCGLWVAGAGGLGPLPGGGAARGTADRSPSPDGTADKSPSRHVDGTLSTFTVLLKVATLLNWPLEVAT